MQDEAWVGTLKVADLKEQLKKRGLPTNGLKADLAERLTDAIRKESAPVVAPEADPVEVVQDQAEPAAIPPAEEKPPIVVAEEKAPEPARCPPEMPPPPAPEVEEAMSIHELLRDEDDAAGEEGDPEPEPEPPTKAAQAPSANQPEGTQARAQKRPASTGEANGSAVSSVETARHAEDTTTVRQDDTSAHAPPEAKRPRLAAPPPALSLSRQMSQRMTPIVSPAAGATTTTRPTAPDVDPADRTHILCIDGLTRPFTEPGLRQMLVSEAGAVGGVVDLEVVDVWLAKLKTHAVVVFGNETQAEAVRKATYMLKWPLGTAKALLPRFVNGEDAAQIKAGGDDGAKGMSSPSAAAAEPSLSTAAVRGGFLAAIKASQQQSLTARGAGAAAAAAAAPETRLISPRGPDLGKETAVDAPTFSNKDRVPQAEEKVYSLDDLFRKTKSKPAIYYLPHTEEYVVKLNQKRSGVATESR